MAWCIPLGEHISVGMSAAAAETDLDDETLMERAAAAFLRHGIDYEYRIEAYSASTRTAVP